ncbi:MAG: anti-sigma factor [Synechococcales bacterium]|nr:anti-sigma factor [Synechococcales bacterium]
MNNSQDWSEMLAGYVLGDLSSEEVIQVQRYLADHPDAVTQLEDLQNTLALLPLGLPDVELPEGLRAQILTAATGDTLLAAHTQNAEQIQDKVIDLDPARSHRPSSHRRNWLPIAGGLAASLIAALGVQNYQLQQQMNAARQEIASLQHSDRYRDQMATLAANNGRTLAMRGSGSVAGASGKVFIVPQQNRALMVIENLPQPPAGKVYHLWAVVNGQKVSCIQFVPEQDGKVVMQIPANRWLQAVEVGVTLESEKTSVMPTGEVVMQGQQI